MEEALAELLVAAVINMRPELFFAALLSSALCRLPNNSAK